MIDWKYCIIGAVLVVVLGMVLKIEYGTFIGIFIPGIIVGYLVNNGYKNGAKNGFITGIIGGFILGILQIIQMIFDFNRIPFTDPVLILIFALMLSFMSAIFDGVGGIIGSLIRDRMM